MLRHSLINYQNLQMLSGGGLTILDTQISSSSINQEGYAVTDVAMYYAGLKELFPGEKVLFKKLSKKIENSTILDIGIGGGRTTKHLLPLTSEYTGVDYVPKYIDIVNRMFGPAGKFLVEDARDLSGFANESFDFVLFSYNGIDVVSHEDRLKVLSEVHRVLRKGGTFMFSSHNRNYRYFRKPYWLKDWRFNPKLIKNVLAYLILMPKRLKMRKHEIFTDEYAIINDSDHRYSFLFYYISIAEQLKQLAEIGFVDNESYDANGELVTADTESFWIYYLAKK